MGEIGGLEAGGPTETETDKILILIKREQTRLG